MGLLLFHGEIIVELAASVLLTFLIFLALALWLWLRPPKMPILPAVVYLLLASVFCIAFLISDSEYLVPAVAFSFPWSWLLIFVSTFVLEYNLGVGLLLPGVALNAILIYGIGKIVKKRNELHL
jgi:hypothetical protein